MIQVLYPAKPKELSVNIYAKDDEILDDDKDFRSFSVYDKLRVSNSLDNSLYVILYILQPPKAYHAFLYPLTEESSKNMQSIANNSDLYKTYKNDLIITQVIEPTCLKCKQSTAVLVVDRDMSPRVSTGRVSTKHNCPKCDNERFVEYIKIIDDDIDWDA